MFNGFMNICSDPKLTFEMSQCIKNTKIISLDEEDMYLELDPNNNPSVIKGSILLPPIESLWAEADGDINQFQQNYYASLSRNEVYEFINALLGYMFNGGNIIIFSPEFDEGGLDTTIHIQFLLNYFETAYGLHLGKFNQDTFRYDINCIPMYLIGIYKLNIITPNIFLLLYPIDAEISQDMYYKLILDTNIYGESLQSKILSIEFLRSSLHENNKCKNALINI